MSKSAQYQANDIIDITEAEDHDMPIIEGQITFRMTGILDR